MTTDWFLQQGIHFDNDETGLGDSHFTGLVKWNSPMEFVPKYSQSDIRNMHPDIRDLALAFNHTHGIARAVVEQNNGGIKQSAVAGDKSKIRNSLHTSRPRAESAIIVAISIHMLKCV